MDSKNPACLFVFGISLEWLSDIDRGLQLKNKYIFVGLEQYIKKQAIKNGFVILITVIKIRREKSRSWQFFRDTRLGFVENNKDKTSSSARLSKVKAQNADSQVRIVVNKGLTSGHLDLCEYLPSQVWNLRSNPTDK